MVDWDELLNLRRARKELGLSQAQLADMLGLSKRAVQSCEQGWRKPSAAVERNLLLLVLAHRLGTRFGEQICWKVKRCAPAVREQCTAYRSRQGHLCWFLTGTLCEGRRTGTWPSKRAACAQCDFMRRLLDGAADPPADTS